MWHVSTLGACALVLGVVVLAGCSEEKKHDGMSGSSAMSDKAEVAAEAKDALDFEVRDIDGKPVNLEKYKGKVVMVVNVASKCGFTPQYEGLEKVYKKYKDRGFVVLGFPANNFGGQEPGSNDQIKEFCTSTYGVTFPMFAKISVKGDDKHPLYQYLTNPETDGRFSGEIGWNFTKFLINRRGEVAGRFESKEAPESALILTAIENELNQNVAMR